MTTGLSATEETEKKANQVLEHPQRHSVAQVKHPTDVTARAVLEGVELRSPLPAEDFRIAQVTCDSRKVQPGSLFVAIQGVATDGNLFATEAASAAPR